MENSEPLRLPTGEWLHQSEIRTVQRFDAFTTIDWMDDELAEHRQRLQKKQLSASARDLFLYLTLTWLVLAAMGAAIGTIAALLNVITAWLASLRLGMCKSDFYLSRSFCCWDQSEKCDNWTTWLKSSVLNFFVYVAWLCIFAWCAATLVKRYAPLASGSGISEIKCIVLGFTVPGFLGWLTLAIKGLGLPLAIASGLSLGKEGPSVHYAACVGNCIASIFNRYKLLALKSREFLTATSAAGVAVAFGLPTGGVLFAMEEISQVFQLLTLWKSYVCALIGVVTLAAFNPFRTGQLVLFEVSYDTSWHYFELPFYALLGVFGGVYGIVVSRLNKRVAGFRKKYLADYAILEVMFLSLVCSLVSYFNQFLRLDMTEVMQELFSECLDKSESAICRSEPTFLLIFSLAAATILRSFLTIITYGCKVPAGIFVPSMAAGATFGKIVGLLVEKLAANPELLMFVTCSPDKPCVISGTYALIGAGAALSGITHLTLTAAVIMFELTGAVRYIIPTMIAVAVTKAINDRWGSGGIADQMIEFNGLPFIDAKEAHVFDTTVAAAMSPLTVVFTMNAAVKVEKVREMLKEFPYRGYPLVKSAQSPVLVGYIVRADLQAELQSADGRADISFASGTDSLNLSSIVRPLPLVVDVFTPLEYLLDVFVRLGPRHVMVEKDGVLVGTITRKDIIRFERTVHELHLPYHDDGWDAYVWGRFQKARQIYDRIRANISVR